MIGRVEASLPMLGIDRMRTASLAAALFVLALGTSANAEPAPAKDKEAASALNFLKLGPAPVDVASFPPPAAKPDERPPGVELHGYVAAWMTPWSEESPTQAKDAFRLRFSVLRVDARPMKNVSVIARLGLMLPGSPLLDFAATWAPHDAFAVTAGQFRLPIGAAATTLAPQIVMLDRPSYVYAMTKLAFRETGVMIHSGPRGIGNGVFHYRLVVAGGGGRLGSGLGHAPGAVDEYLYAARALVDTGRLLFGSPRGRFVLGGTYVRSHDPALDSGDAARDRELAANLLGRTVAPIAKERDTELAGGDVTFSLSGAWAQAEMLYLHSRPTDGTAAREALGASLEVAYTLPFRPYDLANVQFAARGEHFDPNLQAANDDRRVASFGVNVLPSRNVRVSAFGSMTLFKDPATGNARHGGEMDLRFATMF